MSARTEIERRLRSNDYKKISKELFNKAFADLLESEIKRITNLIKN